MMDRRQALYTLSALKKAAPIAVAISANAEWRALGKQPAGRTPYGEWFETAMGGRRVIVFHGGWGKVDAAASAQYAIDQWRPAALVNIGTCGGFAGRIERHEIVLAERTVIYDIVERMGSAEEAIRDYTTAIDLGWLQGQDPTPVRRSTLVSADGDLDPAAIEALAARYGAVAGDWESGAIARVAARNKTRCLILRGVTDLVTSKAGEAYGGTSVFENNTKIVMEKLWRALPAWVARIP